MLALRVGALFVREGSSDHFCTASVVASPGRDLLITAAHCIHSGKGGGYRQEISGDAPITCLNWTSRQSATQLRFDCGGFTGDTSGSPWVAHFDPRTRTGTIVGVIGGYQEGGDTAAISYSSYLGNAVQLLYQEAIADATPYAG